MDKQYHASLRVQLFNRLTRESRGINITCDYGLVSVLSSTNTFLLVIPLDLILIYTGDEILCHMYSWIVSIDEVILHLSRLIWCNGQKVHCLAVYTYTLTGQKSFYTTISLYISYKPHSTAVISFPISLEIRINKSLLKHFYINLSNFYLEAFMIWIQM